MNKKIRLITHQLVYHLLDDYKMQKLLNKINGSRIKYVTMVNMSNLNDDWIKILDRNKMIIVARLNIRTGELELLDHRYNAADLDDLQKLVKIIATEV